MCLASSGNKSCHLSTCCMKNDFLLLVFNFHLSQFHCTSPCYGIMQQRTETPHPFTSTVPYLMYFYHVLSFVAPFWGKQLKPFQHLSVIFSKLFAIFITLPWTFTSVISFFDVGIAEGLHSNCITLLIIVTFVLTCLLSIFTWNLPESGLDLQCSCHISNS